MAFGTVAPDAKQQFFDNNGDPLAGGQVFYYLAGTSTPSAVYSDAGLTVPLPHPIVLDAAGRAPQIFLGANAYKQVLADALGATIWTADNILSPTALRSASASISLTGLQHDVPVPQGIVSFLELRNAAELTIDGFAGGTAGQLLILRALGTPPNGLVHLINANTSGSVSGNQLINFVNSGPTTLTPNSGGTAVYIYLPPWWLLLTHEQGVWRNVPFADLTFKGFEADGTTPLGTWTVTEAAVEQLDVKLHGGSVLITVAILGSTVAGGPKVLQIAGLPYKFKTVVHYLPTVTGLGGTAENGLVGNYVTETNSIEFARPLFTPYADGNVSIWAQFWLDVL